MTNEEMLYKIAAKIRTIGDTPAGYLALGCSKRIIEWKDQQFKEYLKTKKNDILAVGDEPIAFRAEIAVIDEIINELFKENNYGITL